MIRGATCAMAVFAHPDDAELLCFGLLQRLAGEGVRVVILIVSDGSRGVAVGDAGNERLAQIRMRETCAALSGIGAEIRSLDEPDGRITATGEVISAIEAQFMEVRPDLVITHHLDTLGSDHQDHSTVARMVRNICMRKPFVMTLLSAEPLQPFTDFRPTLFVDITDHLKDKVAVLAHHTSQAGRAYLTEEFHRIRGGRWMQLVGAAPTEQPRVFEAFAIERAVWV
jgi:N-acetylglucosamine malate deacetylase 1